MKNSSKLRVSLFLILFWGCAAFAQTVHHYIFFGQDRELLKKDQAFLKARGIDGAQIAYSWRQLEPEKDSYDFRDVREDVELLRSCGKKLFLQLQDVSFEESRINVPHYLMVDPKYGGGANRHYQMDDDKEETARVDGWMSRRWDPAVQERFHKLLTALGSEFDGRVEGINFAETAFDVGNSGKLFPEGFSFETYRDAIITNMKALKGAFPKSVTIQYANFMPGEWLPEDDKGFLRTIYKAAREMNVGVGGPDLLPFRKGQWNHSYPLIKASAGVVPTGIAVQDGNYDSRDPKTGKRVTIKELLTFATENLNVRYIFWCIQEPFYSGEVLPLLTRPRE